MRFTQGQGSWDAKNSMEETRLSRSTLWAAAVKYVVFCLNFLGKLPCVMVQTSEQPDTWRAS
jgi:hypothetical protein